MKLHHFIPNLIITAVGAAFVIYGSTSYVRSIPTPQPVKVATESAVLSEVVKEPQPQPKPTPALPPTTVPTPAPVESPQVKAVKDVVSQAASAIIGSSAATLTSLFSSEVSSAFSSTDLQTSFSNAASQYGTISSVNTLADPHITGDFADQNVEIVTSKGSFRYQLFLKLENGVWKLMGTEPLP